MEHPFSRIAPGPFRMLLVATLVVTFALIFVLVSHGAKVDGLKDAAGRNFDVVAFEFAYTPEMSAHIVETWGEAGAATIRLQTYIDYLFLIAYANCIALCLVGVTSGGLAQRWFQGFAHFLAYGQWLAAICDGFENAFLLQSLGGNSATPGPQFAALLAGVKFVFVLAGILMVFVLLPLRFIAGKPRS